MTVHLIHVGLQESLARRFMPGQATPDWAVSSDDEGNFALHPWSENQVMASLTAKMTGDQHAVRVTIAALYQFDDGDAVPSEEEEIRAFFTDHARELLPFLRQAVYSASIQVWPVKPIMMDVLGSVNENVSA
jgi:hypothetical protein